MLSLNATLAAQQDEQIRQPLMELVSSQFIEDIPFDGQYFNSSTTKEEHPSMIALSNGRLANVFIRPGGKIYLIYSDTDKIEWNEILLKDETGEVYHVSICEISTNVIGIFYVQYSSSTYRLKYMLVSDVGVVNTDGTIIESYAAATATVASANVIKLIDDSYMVVYQHYNVSTEIYSIMERTSADFITWSDEAAIILTGLETTSKKDNPSLVDTAANGLILTFDYVDDIREDGEERVNIYFCESLDDGATFDVPVAITEKDKYGDSAKHPLTVEKLDGKIILTYYDETTVLRASGLLTDGWIADPVWGNCSEESGSVANMHYDPSTGRLYMTLVRAQIGGKPCCGVIVMDVVTWTVVRTYNTSTTPAYSSLYESEFIFWQKDQGEGPYVPISVVGKSWACLINDEDETIIHYNFADNETWSLVKNIDHDIIGGINSTYVDASAKRFYIYWSHRSPWGKCYQTIGYIDITETADPVSGKYTWHEIVRDYEWGEWQIAGGLKVFQIVPEADIIILACYGSFGDGVQHLKVYSLSSGNIIKDYNSDDTPSFHRYGCAWPVYYNGHIYGDVLYTSTHGQGDRRGLMDIDLSSDMIVYHMPSWASLDNYQLMQKVSMEDGRIAMIVNVAPKGVGVFDSRDGTWIHWGEDTLSGLSSGMLASLGPIEYDAETGNIFVGSMTSADEGVFMFNELGAYKIAKYLIAEYDTLWFFDEPANMIIGYNDYELSPAIDSSGVLWSTWTRIDGTEYSLKWDSENPNFNLSDYVISGSEIKVRWDVESNNKLSFQCSHGHFFDPQNLMSILSGVLRKKRKISLRFGDKISGINYWQDQGTFVITSTSLSYQKGDYPIISVNCEDKRCLWRGEIVATEAYADQWPEAIISSILQTYCNMESTEIQIDDISNRHKIWHQFIGTTAKKAVQEILEHFGYFGYMDVDGNFVAKRLDPNASTDHEYSDLSKSIGFTSDDSFSDFTNRVVVKGEGRYFIEVLYTQESVGSLNGTIGWWGEKIVKRVYYSEDRERTCRDPVLEVIQSVADFEIFKMKGGGTQYISSVDDYEKWIEITIEAPNLVGIMIANVILILATGIFAMACDWGKFCGAMIFALSLLIGTLFYMLGCVATYNYNIFAKPIGHEKQTFQNEANDFPTQRELDGQVITQSIDDPFCYTVTSCGDVAGYEMDVLIAQRNRVKFGQIADLRIEIGDVILRDHPYSGEEIRTFMTNLDRRYKKPSGPGKTDGYFLDDVQGWRQIT